MKKHLDSLSFSSYHDIIDFIMATERTVQKRSHRYCIVVRSCDGYSYTKGGAAFPTWTTEPGIATSLCLMTKKESEKEVERPHYYSQFWLDVAAGRRVIGTPRAEEGAEGQEPETAEASALHRPGRNNLSVVTDGYQETHAQSAVEPTYAPDEFAEPEPELEEDLIGAVDDLDIPNIIVDETEVPAADIAPEEEEEPEEDFFEEEEEEEPEEDWNVSRGRKKAKPSRPTKQPPKRVEKRRRF